ncbi:hypothetical protein EV193_10548 [Herbihabitans rhizosphaerae]|uniref:Polysaccharide pyruvyl transferase n=1 Tax=Herbihabitans rhizosphaerae TaxID=1872711 RepID=A0A4V2ESG5_9PSEU|nr:hypothetical protein [Herbihabitans rhizosphaerae]RZS37493.1 hypothetical protein EV193_10548 [Herbihabitans rhizosphaerae]
MSAPSDAPAAGAVAIWGSTDLPGLGDQLLSRVTEHELLARLPGWRADTLAPLGWLRPSIADEGRPAAPFGLYDHTRCARLAGATALSLVCPSFPLGLTVHAFVDLYPAEDIGDAHRYLTAGLGEDLERTHPIAWAGVRVAADPYAALITAAERVTYRAVRDTRSRDRLVAAGLTGEITVIPHPALAVRQTVDTAVLDAVRAQLRQLGVLPGEGDYAVLALATSTVDGPDEVAPGLADALTEVLADTGAEHVVVLPDLASTDRLAVLAGATVVIATDEHVAAATAGLGVHWVLLDVTGEDGVAAAEFGQPERIVRSADGLAAAVRSTRNSLSYKDSALEALNVHFGRLAELAAAAGRARGTGERRDATQLVEENAALRRALDRHRQLAMTERERLIDAVRAAEDERDAARAEVESARAGVAEAERRTQEIAALAEHRQQELDAWEHTKLVRWSSPLRKAYGKAKGR